MAESPEFIGKYRISHLIARGGMGAVYKAVHPTLSRPVILKKLTVRNAQFIERFKREAKIMMDFKHDNIVTVYDHFKEGNSYYIALEYVDGFSLDELIKRERALPSVLAMHIFLEICRALKYAHDSGVIHRDIKPANILISRAGEVKLVDFGIAAYEEGEDDGEALTTHGMTLGTPSYMPPEQFENTRGVDKCADIYAMGIVLYEMVTGKKAFPGNFSPDTINSIQKGRYVRVRRLNPKVDKTIVRLTGKMIRPKKERRFQDLAPVVRLLERRLKREDTAQEDQRLLAMMNGKAFTAKKRPGKALKRFLSAAFVVALVAAFPVAAILSSGVYHEWLDPADWGKFSVSINRPGSSEDEMPVSVHLYSDRSGEIKRVSELRLPGFWRLALGRIYAIAPKKLTPKSVLAALKPSEGLGTDSVYAKPGWYRIKVQSGNKLLWDSVYLEPMVVQRSGGRGKGLLLSYRLGEPIPKAVTFHFEITDERLKRDITSKCRILIEGRSGFVNFADFPAAELVSGRAFRIRVTSPGYRKRDFSILVQRGQTEVGIQAALAVEVARLTLNTSLPSAEFTINGRREILSGADDRKLSNLAVSRGTPLSLELPPGSYSIGTGTGRKSSEKEVKLEAGDALSLEFYQDPATKALRLR
jgi:eukaryotic-like serine/threonine-protein kinase